MPNESQRKKTIKQNISKSEKELKRMISDRRAVIQGLITTATYRADFASSAIKRDRLYKKLREQYTHLNSDLDAWTLKTGESVSRQARKYVVADLPKSANIATFNEFSEKHLTDIIGAINPSTVDKQVAVNAKIGGMYDRDIQIIRQAVTQGIAQGAVEGLTNPQMADLMRQAITNKAGTLSFLDKRGRKWSADAYFGMLNRTIHAQVARESYNAMSTDAGYDLAMIEGGITAASLSSPSDPCSRWAGKIISLTGATKGYPTYQDAINDGMFHPNCAHFTRALTKSEIPEAKQEEKEIAKQGAEARAEVNKERKADGLTPNKYAGEDGKAATSG